MTGGLAFGGDDKRDDWVDYRLTVDKIRPNGIIVLDDGLEVELHKTDMRIKMKDGKRAKAIGVIDAEAVYEYCPLCDEEVREGDIVILTDKNFSLYPCLSCGKMVEQKTPKSNFRKNLI